MTEGEKTRLVAWSREMRRVHDRLREALRVTQEAGRRGRYGGVGDPMIGHQLGGLQRAVDQRAHPAELDRHLEGSAAIMESHVSC